MQKFMETLNAKLRAHDAYGVWKKLDDATVISRHYVLSKEDKKKIDVYGRMPDDVIAKMRLYYEAVAQTVEWQTGKMAITILDINTEGFGRALVAYEDAILCQRVHRNAHKFGFKDLEDIESDGEKLVAACLKKLSEMPEE
jgi:probable nitrogen fixation protein